MQVATLATLTVFLLKFTEAGVETMTDDQVRVWASKLQALATASEDDGLVRLYSEAADSLLAYAAEGH
jgi:hypothetical protein